MTNRLTLLMLKLCDYTFDLKYQQGKKMFLSDALSRLHIEAEKVIGHLILLNFLEHLNKAYIHY